MKKVLLVQESPRMAKKFVNRLPPLGILYIASYLEKRGVHCDVVDRNIERHRRIDFSKYGYVGFTMSMSNVTSTLKSIKEVKDSNPQVKVIVGGPVCISNPIYFIENKYIDAVCAGEGEDTLLEYVMKEGNTKEPIKGMYIKDSKGTHVYSGDRGWIDNLDSLPFPAFDKVDIRKYYMPIRKAHPISSIITSRGCPYGCIFCFRSLGKKWRGRSAENVVDEIEWQVKELGIREICILDENFSMDLDRAKKICDIIREREINIRFQSYDGVRVDCLDQELLNKFSQIGLWLITISPETGSDYILKRLKKKFTLSQAEEVAASCKKLGFTLYAQFMIGFPFEKRRDMMKTVEFTRRINPTFVQYSIVTPLPGTELYELMDDKFKAKDANREQSFFYGGLKCHIEDMDDREVIKFTKKAYRRFYLNPVKIAALLRTIRFTDLFRLFIAALRTNNL